MLHFLLCYVKKTNSTARTRESRDRYQPSPASTTPQKEEEDENTDSESKNHLEKTQLFHVVQYLEDLVTVCSNIAPWLLGLREEQSGSETDSEISVSSQHSVYPSVCLSVYLTVKLSLSANSSP